MLLRVRVDRLRKRRSVLRRAIWASLHPGYGNTGALYALSQLPSPDPSLYMPPKSAPGLRPGPNTARFLGGKSMARNILILGASYGSLLGTKLLMAGHNVTLVCRKKTAELINREGTLVRIKLRDEAVHRAIFSRDLPGKLDAITPAEVDVSRYDLVALAMQEPQYANHTVRVLMIKIAAAGLPCLSIMNMPPLPYLKRIPSLSNMDLEEAYTNAQVWERFKPGLVTLCSPDPQAFRPPEEAANVLHVGLPTNFKASAFADDKHNKELRELEADIDAGALA